MKGKPTKNEENRAEMVGYIKRYFEQYGTAPLSGPHMYLFPPLSPSSKLTPALHILTEKQVLIKTIDRELLSVERRKLMIDEEIRNSHRINHMRVAKVLEVLYTSQWVLIVYDCEPGLTLSQVIRKGEVRETEAREVFRQLVEGVKAMHEVGVVHRDLRPECIRVSNGKVKIEGLQNSKRVKRGQDVVGTVGALAYMGPETLLSKGYDGYAADIWSLGVLLYLLLTGTEPFTGKSHIDIQKAILKGNITFPKHIHPHGIDLTSKLLALRPQSRPSLREIKDHVWMTGDSERPRFTHIRSRSNSMLVNNYVVNSVEKLGFPRGFTVASLRAQSMNQATVCYHLLNRPN